MLRLNLSPKPSWIDLAHGVRVECEPVSSTVMIGAREDLPEDMRAASNAVAFVANTKAIARRVIRAWEGVMDEKGKALPVTPEAVDALMEQSVECFAAFNRNYVNKGNALVDEGNGSAPSPSGDGEAETTTAAAAPADAKPAPKGKSKD